MQLITRTPKVLGKVGAALAAASSSLLASSYVHADESPLVVDTALLIYSEAAGRVNATEPIVSMKKDFGDEHILGLKFTYDSLTGASPNGAVPTKETVTITGPSGRGGYTTTVGALPKNNFKDQREGFNASWSQPLGENNHISLGGDYSHENDYLSSGYNLAYARDLFEKNTTLSVGINRESDTNSAIGGIPVAFASNNLLNTGRLASTNKQVKDYLVGITQVMSRSWLMQLNYSHSYVSGYQNDPYKILSVLDSQGNSIADPASTDNKLFLYENRPDQRTRKSIFWDNKIHLTEDVIDISLRHYSDDWGINSNTLDLHYHMEVGDSAYWEPHYRYYTQTAANFYRPFLMDGSDVMDGNSTLAYASSDPRLAKFTAQTIGIKFGFVIDPDNEFYLRVEKYQQNPANLSAASNLSALDGLKINPGLKATTFLVGYTFTY